MRRKQISLYIDGNISKKIEKYIQDNNIKSSDFYREIFELGFEQKTKNKNYFLTQDYMLEMMYRTLTAAEKAANLTLEDKKRIKANAEAKVVDLLMHEKN